jgi:hypothetical protein
VRALPGLVEADRGPFVTQFAQFSHRWGTAGCRVWRQVTGGVGSVGAG